MGIFNSFTKYIGIDLGTANTLVYVKGKGIVIDEPSVVSINKKTGQVLAVGKEAQKMVGRTPTHIVAIRPLVDGVISDFEVTEQMLKYFIDKVTSKRFSFLSRPTVLVGIPSGVTEVEKKAVHDAAISAGANRVYLIEEPMAAAIGARVPIQDAGGNMIVDIGGGTSEMAVISLGGVVIAKSLRVAGDKMNDDIIRYARAEHGLLLGDRMAEEIKIAVGAASPLEKNIEVEMRGRDLVTGLPKAVVVNDEDIRKALMKSVRILINNIRTTVEETPPELVSDLMERGIVLAGGGSLIRGLDKAINDATEIPVKVVEDPLTAVVRGAGLVIEDINHLEGVLIDDI